MSSGKYKYRLIRRWFAEEKRFCIWMTNLPRERWPAEKVMALYRCRWQIELLFKELKSHNRLKAFATRQKAIAEGLIWAGLLALLVKRRLGTDIQTYIEREFGVAYELSNVYRLLRELGFSWITSRSRHPKQDGQVQEALKTSSWKRSLTSRVMLRLPMSMSGFRTKPGLVNKIRLPDCGPGVAVAPSYSATTIRVRLSLRCRLPCNRDNGSLAQSSGKPGGDEAALGTDCSTNKAGSSCGGDHGRRRMAYHGMCG